MAFSGGAYGAQARSSRLLGLAVIVAFHAVVLAGLWQLDPVRSALSSTPIVVNLIEPPRPKVEPPKPLPQKPPPPKPQPRKVEPARVVPTPVPTPAPVLAAAPEAPAVQSAPPAPPVETPPVPPAPPVVAVAPPPPPVTPPRFNADYLNNPPPAYPPISRRMGEEGKVILRVHVTAKGLPDDIQLRTSSGSQRLDAAALETVKQWKFVPARRGETPVDAWVVVPISFSLRS